MADQQFSSQIPTTTQTVYINSAASASLLAQLIPAFSGVIVALFAALLGHYLTSTRDRKLAGEKAASDEVQNAVQRAESMRKERTQRQFDALERAAASIFSARNELEKLESNAEQAIYPESALGPLSEGCAFLHIHFGEEFSGLTNSIQEQYAQCIKCLASIATAAFWLKRRRDDGNVDMTSAAHERANYDDAKKQYVQELKMFDDFRRQLLAALKAQSNSLA